MTASSGLSTSAERSKGPSRTSRLKSTVRERMTRNTHNLQKHLKCCLKWSPGGFSILTRQGVDSIHFQHTFQQTCQQIFASTVGLCSTGKIPLKSRLKLNWIVLLFRQIVIRYILLGRGHREISSASCLISCFVSGIRMSHWPFCVASRQVKVRLLFVSHQ